jgi:predicted NAD/FAD-binding protein
VSGRQIAVIGGGISGLTAACILARTDEVTVFEAGDRLGGHADTHLVPEPGGPPVPVDRWRLYLAGGALAFEEGRIGVDQILAARRG